MYRPKIHVYSRPIKVYGIGILFLGDEKNVASTSKNLFGAARNFITTKLRVKKGGINRKIANNAMKKGATASSGAV